MRRVFSNPLAALRPPRTLAALRPPGTLTALAVGLCLRLFFVLKFPAGSGDTALYEQIATNWLKHGIYAMDVAGTLTPVDLRMPGYPAFLAIIYALAGKTGDAARLWVMFAQIAVDLLSCVATGALATLLLTGDESPSTIKRLFSAGLWLAALCPFTANYTAVPLTEVFATLLTVVALILLVLLQKSFGGYSVSGPELRMRLTSFLSRHFLTILSIVAGFVVGLATLFRPESPLILIAAWLVFAAFLSLRLEWRRFWLILPMGIAWALPLLPWAARNAVTLHEVQFLAPRNSNLPGELVPYGFMAWEKTWLYRVRDCYLVPWKLNDDVINLEEIPANAFDTPEEKERVAAILDQYNDDFFLTPNEDAAFAKLAKERTSRHPLRTYLWLPVKRAVRIWFTPRIELLPVSGHVFPLAYMWEEDPVDQRVTSGLFLLNIVYIALGVWGAFLLWQQRFARPAVALMIVFILLRTVFLTTLETPEPRYVLVCFPALLALAAQVFAKRGTPSL